MFLQNGSDLQLVWLVEAGHSLSIIIILKDIVLQEITVVIVSSICLNSFSHSKSSRAIFIFISTEHIQYEKNMF